eukprot:361151-Chlamydomonas_euryale.AAC.3
MRCAKAGGRTMANSFSSCAAAPHNAMSRAALVWTSPGQWLPGGRRGSGGWVGQPDRHHLFAALQCCCALVTTAAVSVGRQAWQGSVTRACQARPAIHAGQHKHPSPTSTLTPPAHAPCLKTVVRPLIV